MSRPTEDPEEPMSRSRPAALLVALALFTTFAASQDRKEPPPPLGTASFTPPEGNTKLQPLTPETFVVRAAVTNMAEIELGQLALGKSADEAVRKFATQLIKDHQAAQGKLKSIAKTAKIALPGTVDEEHRRQKEQLSELVGAEFDKQFVALMHSGHQQAIGLFQSAGSAGDLDVALKNYASEALSTVNVHAAEAERLQTRR
jgi:putative membrane protein